MESNYTVIIVTMINVILGVAIIGGVYKVVKSFKRFVERNREIDRKVDLILQRLEKFDNM